MNADIEGLRSLTQLPSPFDDSIANYNSQDCKKLLFRSKRDGSGRMRFGRRLRSNRDKPKMKRDWADHATNR
ncbi:hypothetical protein CEP54_016323 [Fusarium duplospermum]|uniref:Uncharacterized protein n=1 Tax=Fusarium duplospermum TaxID=1325734 RepID=A0A428NF42_9HYPO|nr:hypothetical protein CEP54_016323 [Fusarium duplospermum]